MTKITIQPSEWKPTASPKHDQYDAAIVAVGYERRAKHAYEMLAPESRVKIGVHFSNLSQGSYKSNLSFFTQRDFECVPFPFWNGGFVQTRIMESRRINYAKCEVRDVRVFVDISSMSRFMLASVVVMLWKLSFDVPVIVDFVYSVAAYTPPHPEMEQIANAGPVLPEFSAWGSPHVPTAAIIGLGYELHKALGILEFIEPAQVWVLQGRSPDPKYDRGVDKANRLLCEGLPSKSIIQYRVAQPLECYSAVESLVAGVSREFRPVLVPFGPKVFALCCMLTAVNHYPAAAVWRVSSELASPVVDRRPAGPIFGLTARFSVSPN